MRRRNRNVVLKSLVNSGVNITLYGNGWDKLPYAQSDYIHIRPAVSFDGQWDVIASAKINLNVNPLFKSGIHDRIFSTILNRTVIATDESEKIADNFTDGSDSLIFSMTDTDEFSERVRVLLSDDEHLQSIADRGYERSDNYSMLEMVLSILEMISAPKSVDHSE